MNGVLGGGVVNGVLFLIGLFFVLSAFDALVSELLLVLNCCLLS